MEANVKLPDIPGYKIEKKLGKGGMADVYLGVQEALERRVAIKILNPDMIRNRQLLERFLNEARTASRLEHLNIVTIHDVGQFGDYCYITMEYLYESLVDRIKFSDGLKLPHQEAFRILKQMAKALAYAHKEGFIHRDIKPDNILFRKDNTPVLVDFGIARAVDSDSRLTTVGMIIGTPHYMSPEQCRGEKIDGQSDIYSLGVVLYEMLTGNIPFKADSAAGLLVKHIQEPIPHLPPRLGRYQPLLDRMMAKDKANRIHTADELLNVIDMYVSNSRLETIEASRPDQWVFQAPAAGSTGGYDMVGTSDSDPTTLSSPMRHTKKKSSLLLILFIMLLIGGGGYLAYIQWFDTGEQNQSSDTGANSQTNSIDVDEKEPVLPAHRNDGPKQNADTPITPPKETQKEKPPATTEPTISAEDQKLAMLLKMAGEYLQDGNIEKAEEKLKQARDVKDTPDIAGMEKQIHDFREAQKDKAFMNHLSRAMASYKKGNLSSAKNSLAKAKKIKNTKGVMDLSRKINQKERALRQAAQRRKLDDEAYQTARSRNTIYSYEKYLKKYARGRHADKAKKRFEQLKSSTTLEIKIKDDVSFETASSKNSIASYEAYLKEYPFGQHAAKARKKIEAIKLRLAKEIKERIKFQRLRFFESGTRAQAIGQRKYSSRFPQATTRYVYTEIQYINRLFRIADSQNTVVINYKGPFLQELKGVISTLKDEENGFYWRGMGWQQGGKWAKGTYTITVTIQGKYAGKSTFEIF